MPEAEDFIVNSLFEEIIRQFRIDAMNRLQEAAKKLTFNLSGGVAAT